MMQRFKRKQGSASSNVCTRKCFCSKVTLFNRPLLNRPLLSLSNPIHRPGRNAAADAAVEKMMANSEAAMAQVLHPLHDPRTTLSLCVNAIAHVRAPLQTMLAKMDPAAAAAAPPPPSKSGDIVDQHHTLDMAYRWRSRPPCRALASFCSPRPPSPVFLFVSLNLCFFFYLFLCFFESLFLFLFVSLFL
jgi:hypothetical protein